MAVEDIVKEPRNLTEKNRVYIGKFLEERNKILRLYLFPDHAVVFDDDYYPQLEVKIVGKVKRTNGEIRDMNLRQRVRKLVGDIHPIDIDRQGRIQIPNEAICELPEGCNSFLVYNEGDVVCLEYQTDKQHNKASN